MIPTTEISEAEICYPAWILEYLWYEYPEIYGDLIRRKTPSWLKPTFYEDFFDDSIVQKLFIWADPAFIRFCCGFIRAIDSILRADVPVIHLESLFDDLVSRFFTFYSFLVSFVFEI